MYQFDNNKIQQQIWNEESQRFPKLIYLLLFTGLFHDDKLTSEIFVILHSKILNFAVGFNCCRTDTSTLYT